MFHFDFSLECSNNLNFIYITNIKHNICIGRSELVGTAGVVKIRFDEEAPSPTPTTPASIKRFEFIFALTKSLGNHL